MRAVAVGLVCALLCGASTAGAQVGPALSVDGAADNHAISSDIYGLNFADPALAGQLDLPVDRWGGDTTDTYNWQLHSANTSANYFYENIADCDSAAHHWCGDPNASSVSAADDQIAGDRRVGSKSLITLPMVGYVAKDAPQTHPFTCGFPASQFAVQDSFDPYDAGCGNGLRAGTKLPSDPLRDGTPVGASFGAGWVSDLAGRYGSAAHGGVALYELGNEPGLWNDTHRDIHPSPTTYDELWQKTRDLAAAVKQTDPTAGVLGFSEWAWPNYFCSASDTATAPCSAASPDRAAHGGTPIIAWLLQQARAHEQATGVRLLDYLDLHYYAQGGKDASVTRSLWDPTFTDPSWIADEIQLLPRMRQWIADNYPGTRIALSEYNLSPGADPVLNALVQADTLGIFAREGVSLATRWGLGNDGNLIGDAFRLFRNYDHAHSKFGDTWVRSTSADQSQLAVYGARRSSDGAYTIMVLNKTTSPLLSRLALSNVPHTAGSAQVWQWAGGGGIHRGSDQSVGTDGFTALYPGRSVTLFVLPSGTGGALPDVAGAALRALGH